MKLIIDISEEDYKNVSRIVDMGLGTNVDDAIKNGTPLANDSERAEVQAYFAGQTYGWEQGRKALIDDVKAEIKQIRSHSARFRTSDGTMVYVDSQNILEVLDNVLDNIGKESEDT